jgi:hypothetical protein
MDATSSTSDHTDQKETCDKVNCKESEPSSAINPEALAKAVISCSEGRDERVNEANEHSEENDEKSSQEGNTYRVCEEFEKGCSLDEIAIFAH